MTSLVDVIVPLHDAAEHLPVFLASVQVNSPAGCRYLVIDDGSRDGSTELLDAAAARLPSLELHRLEHSVGVAAARNAALELVDAEYLAFVDADDWMAPERLSQLIAAHRRTGAAILRTDHVRVNRYRRIPEVAPSELREVAFPAGDGIGDAGGRTLVDYPYLWAGMFDLAQLPPLSELRFDPSLRTASDRPWFWRLHLLELSVAVVAAPSYFYRRSPGQASLTELGDDRLLDILDAMRQVLALAAASGVPAYRRRAAFTTVRMIARHVSARGRLDADQQHELVRRAAELLAEIDADDLAAALELVRPEQAEVAQALCAAGRRWSE
ncbi:glycosyl transferase family 2 [Propionicimonas paludicola]|uniref:Glycosyl transferase family 2 n=1 Tax=Propionicimonas paludicola TaxID=185243 RepID=A0A2A9CW56_9ACTN|nr:glycosyltransferase family 2 protein [Propionicimonas paludicola]PFG18366.1 glycosyl transferase family 2 [Propionicimonas paludicola]